MATDPLTDADQGNGPYQLFMVGLSIYVLASLFAQAAFRLHPQTLEILDLADLPICLVFFVDFLACFARSSNKKEYLLTWGWLDLMSSIPTVDWFRWGRAARAFRILRVLRGVRATRLLSGFALRRRAESAFWGTTLLAILLVIFGSIGVLHLERDAGGNIATAQDALWWSIVTVTTVGYGDFFPVTPPGRVLAVSLMMGGIGLVGTFTALLASQFVEPEEDETQVLVRALHVEVAALRADLAARDRRS